MPHKFQDKTLPIEERIDDLLEKMTLEEKVRQLDIYSGWEMQDKNRNFQLDKLLETAGTAGIGCIQNRFASAKANNEIQRAVTRDGEIQASLDVTNTGKVYGEDVPQFYIHDTYSSVVRPYKELAGFVRVGLKPGETKTVTVSIGSRQLRLLNRDFRWEVEPGEFTIMAGSHSCDLPFSATLTVVE